MLTEAQVNVGTQLSAIVHLMFWLLELLVVARVIISWAPVNRYHPAVRFIFETTEPMLRPFRTVLRIGAGGLDFSPIVLLIVLSILERVVTSLLRGG